MSRAATSVFTGGWSSVWGPGSSLYQSSQVVLPFWVRGLRRFLCGFQVSRRIPAL